MATHPSKTERALWNKLGHKLNCIVCDKSLIGRFPCVHQDCNHLVCCRCYTDDSLCKICDSASMRATGRARSAHVVMLDELLRELFPSNYRSETRRLRSEYGIWNYAKTSQPIPVNPYERNRLLGTPRNRRVSPGDSQEDDNDEVVTAHNGTHRRQSRKRKSCLMRWLCCCCCFDCGALGDRVDTCLAVSTRCGCRCIGYFVLILFLIVFVTAFIILMRYGLTGEWTPLYGDIPA